MEDLLELYQRVIVQHARAPRNRQARPHCSHHAKGRNPMCGDECEIYLDIEQGRITKASFAGEGCALSMASASLLTEAVLGKTVEQARNLSTEISRLTHAQSAEPPQRDRLGDLAALAGVQRFPGRQVCALLAWQALDSALSES